jgi:hypothetical protein
MFENLAWLGVARRLMRSVSRENGFRYGVHKRVCYTFKTRHRIWRCFFEGIGRSF